MARRFQITINVPDDEALEEWMDRDGNYDSLTGSPGSRYVWGTLNNFAPIVIEAVEEVENV